MKLKSNTKKEKKSDKIIKTFFLEKKIKKIIIIYKKKKKKLLCHHLKELSWGEEWCVAWYSSVTPLSRKTRKKTMQSNSTASEYRSRKNRCKLYVTLIKQSEATTRIWDKSHRERKKEKKKEKAWRENDGFIQFHRAGNLKDPGTQNASFCSKRFSVLCVFIFLIYDYYYYCESLEQSERQQQKEHGRRRRRKTMRLSSFLPRPRKAKGSSCFDTGTYQLHIQWKMTIKNKNKKEASTAIVNNTSLQLCYIIYITSKSNKVAVYSLVTISLHKIEYVYIV